MANDPWVGRIRMIAVLACTAVAFVVASVIAVLVRAGLVGAFIDAAGIIPVRVWLAIVGLVVMVVVLIWAMTAPLTTPEQRDEIACRYREYGGKGVTASTRSTARPAPGGTSQRRPQSGAPATAQERGRPRRDRQT